MAWSNIFLQLVTLTGPVIGEGLLDGWETSIELEKFSWDLTYNDTAKAPAGGGLGGAIASAASALVGIGSDKNVEMGRLKMTKRFDIASAMIHTCLDNHLPILSASITVLNIKHGGRAIHQPGFTLVATNGYFTDVELDMESSGKGVEVKENLTLQFKSIVVSYLKRTGKDNVPTNPFFFSAPEKKKGLF
jgi:type VI protein secretion system component Hcp